MNKRVIFLLKSEKTPSSRIRGKELCPYLEEQGIETEIEYIPKSFFERMKLFKKCGAYDLTLFQKRLFSMLEFRELRKNAKKLIFDFDDAVYMKNAVPSENDQDYVSRTRERRFARIISAVDLAIAANSYLAAEAHKTAPSTKVEILPSSVDTEGLEIKTDYTLGKPPVIGWVGSKVTHRYLKFISEQLCELRKKYNFILNVISDKNLLIPGLEIKNIKWSREAEICEISKFDIGIMPLSDDPFSQGKASYKLLQYMTAGVPSVASAVGMNIEVAGNNEFAISADSPAKFAEAVEKLLTDEKLRHTLGEKGRRKIEREYSRQVIGQKFASIIENQIQT